MVQYGHYYREWASLGPQQSPRSAVSASRAPVQPPIPEQPPPQTVLCHRARMPPQGALGQPANSNLHPCPFLLLVRLTPRPPSVDTRSHEAIQMPNAATRRVGADMSLGLGVGRSGGYAILKRAIYRGLSVA